MANPTVQRLRGLALTSTELRQLNPEWSDTMIEDYLNIIDNLTTLSGIIDEKQDILRTVITVTFADSPYDIEDVDQIIDFDTTGGDIVANLPAGVDGRYYRMTDVASNGNKVILSPDGAELLFGTSTENINNAETLIMTFSVDNGWW